MADELEVLGHTIKGHKIMPFREKITHIIDFPIPKNKKKLQQFLGSVNYIGSHLPHIATLQAPLTELTGTQQWECGYLQDNAFNQVKTPCKQNLPISPINYENVLDPKTNYNLDLVTDASKVGVGSFLCHGESFEKAKQNIDTNHCRKFTPAQCNYSTTDQELLAIIDALLTFEPKLLRVKFTIITDHMALHTLITQTVRKQQRIRWLKDMTMFDFDIQHIQGEENILADVLSRIYDKIDADKIMDQDYLQKEENYINTDTFLPNDPSATQFMLCPIPNIFPLQSQLSIQPQPL